MVDKNGNSCVPWRWVVWVLLTITFATIGFIINDTKADVLNSKEKISQLQKDKLDKEQYYRDVGEVKDSLNYLVRREMSRRK